MKYLIDLSLEIDTEDISATGDSNIVITKDIRGQKVVLNLPANFDTAEGFISGGIMDHYWNAQRTERRNGTGGFWLREKKERDDDELETGLHLSLTQKPDPYLNLKKRLPELDGVM